MRAYVTRFALPSEPSEVHRMFDMHGEPRTDLDTLLRGEDVNWSLPNSVMGNDVVFFQYTSSSKQNLKTLRAAAMAEGDVEVLAYLDEATQRIESSIGRLVAVGKVMGDALRNDDLEGAHFRQRLFAPISQISPFRKPLSIKSPSPLCRLPEFMPGGSLSNRAFVSDENYQRILSALQGEGNSLPPIIDATHIRPTLNGAPLSQENWMEYATAEDAGFFLEAHMRGTFVDYLLRELSDDRKLHDEVLVQKSGMPTSYVDNAIRIGGKLVPVESKLNARSERDLLGQIRKYTRPDELIARDSRRLGSVEHDVVVLVDRDGVYILIGAAFHDCDLTRPLLQRTKIDRLSIGLLRATIARLCGGEIS